MEQKRMVAKTTARRVYQNIWLIVFMSLGFIQAQEPLNVVATYSILGEFVEAVGGELVQVTTLVGRDGDAHEYEPTPQDSVAIAEAALVFENGLEFETWLDDLFTASGSDATRVVVTNGITPRPMSDFGDHTHAEDHAEGDAHSEGEEHAESEDHAHEHDEFDPHVWQNPQLVVTMIDTIATALSAADPTNEATYLANATNYKTALVQLDSDLQAQADTLTAEQRKLVTSHDAVGYFAYRYGFEVIGAVIPSVTTETSDANAGELAKLVDTVRAAGVPAIFVENTSSTELVEQVASSAGVVVAPALYTDALGAEDSDGATYIDMMRYNMATIVTALSQ
jgi:zinc/manganese transport system substrate-binding protein